MWTEDVKDRYWWLTIRNELEELLGELLRAEDDEGTDLYLLQLHFANHSEIEFFTKAEQTEIKKLLSILINDTAKHRNLLAQMAFQLKELSGDRAK